MPSVVVLLLIVISIGCGGDVEVTWPGNAKKDWVKNVSGRGMGNVWGVILNVDKIEGEISINPEGTFGKTPAETNASNEIFFGNVVIKLETTNREDFKLFVNGKRYGKVKKGYRVHVDTDRNVNINGQPRKVTN